MIADASLVVDWLIGVEASDAVDQIFASKALVAPSLLRLEVANALRNILARRQIDSAFREGCLLKFRGLKIVLDDAAMTSWDRLDAVVGYSDRHRLTLYDAAYLELALRKALPLASFYRPLIDACRRENVDVIAL